MSKEPPILRNSERTTFRRCPQKWWWSYREGLVGRYEQANALWFGTGVHVALAQWYRPGKRRGLRLDVAWDQWVQDDIRDIRTAISDDFQEDVFVDAKALGDAMLMGYYKKYDYDEKWDVIQTEQTFQVEIPDPDKPGKVLVVLAGTFDGVFYDADTGEVWLMEHKTAKQISTAHLEMDDQAGTYWMVASSVLQDEGILKKNQQIAGIRYNYLRKGMPDEREQDSRGRYLNKNGTISKVQPSPLFVRLDIERGPRERGHQLQKIQDEAIWMREIRKGRLPIIKNVDWTCYWQCPFFEMCQLHEHGDKGWETYRDAMYTRRDPYSDHRKSASEGA
jgi:hypothetical protein